MSPKPFSIQTPLPPKDLFFESMTHTAALSELEDMQLQLLSDKPDVSPDDVLGQKVKVSIELRDGARRHLNGYVTRFGIGVHQGRYFGYHAVVRPWLWFLTRTTDCRIFQEMTVPQIVERVFKDHDGIADYEFKLARKYRKRTYCVQYRESDFNFVARLLEDEGIYWYFKHGDGTHRLMLVDDASLHGPIQGNPTLPYYEDTSQVPSDTEYLSGWRFAREVQPGKSVLTSYDFERPSLKLQVEHSEVRGHAQAEHEVFDFQGDYLQKPHGQQLVETRLTEHQARWESSNAGGNAHAVACGYQFKLSRHPRGDQNRQYLLTRVEISARNNGAESTAEPGELRCTLKAIPATQPYSPVRRTPKPFVQGPQTAVVVGKDGEEIHTDNYGRVKVQFHWDRYGHRNETSSCWIRVSTPWAGKSFGFVQIPRIGQEVVVDFLEGDPDQPLITGRVYNAEQMPPWELPANATQSGVLTRSSKAGGYDNANALRFEDKKGAEQVWLHAEKNQDIEVENDETHWVGHDRSKTIDHDETVHVKHDRTETVDHDETITIHHDRKERVDQDETISIGRDRTEVVGADERITIGDNRTERVGANETITIGANRTESVGANETVRIGANRAVTIGGNKAETVAQAKAETIGLAKALSIGGAYQVSVGAAMNATVGASSSEQVGLAKSVAVGKTYRITAGDELSITVGQASLVMKKDGTIVISGKDIFLNGKNVDVVGDAHIGLESRRIDLN